MSDLQLAAPLSQLKFPPPKPMPELNGEHGLTSADIAEGLGIEAKYVNYSLRKRGYAEKLRDIGCRVVPILPVADVTASKSLANLPGRKTARGHGGFILDGDASQIFVVQSKTKNGIKFAKFLIDFFKKASENIPALIKENQHLKAELEFWRNKQNQKKLKGPATVDYLVRAYTEETLFGEVEVYEERVKIPKASLNETELRRAKISHLGRIAKGVTAHLERLQAEEERLSLPADRRI